MYEQMKPTRLFAPGSVFATPQGYCFIYGSLLNIIAAILTTFGNFTGVTFLSSAPWIFWFNPILLFALWAWQLNFSKERSWYAAAWLIFFIMHPFVAPYIRSGSL